jgi:hypothetical protein
MTRGSCGDIMVRAERGIRAPRPALTTGTMLEASHVMAAHHPTISGVAFKDAAGFPGYCVGDDGSVWSSRRGAWFRMKLRPHYKTGHLLVNLAHADATNGKAYRFVHTMVLDTFVGPCPPGMECRHLDGCPENNRLANLCWGTPAENVADQIRHGTIARGSRNGSAKLGEAQVFRIRRQLEAGVARKEICRRFGISKTNLYYIGTHKYWGHVK